ncbi:unnamed protein product [Owenia fusiformis]|uniref:DUF4455 domain-containing protein n=1 Tax=Owenia fusiformis TaxID=6347 RepID=A0A8S4P0W9_OWEFU|nr:unnamed protein product [Owenia fusiformis]
MSNTELNNPVRLVPSGKVYRQIFDAQVQLVKTLEESKDVRRSKSNVIPSKTPLVNTGRSETGAGLLTSRQQTWAESFPNESNPENPVVHKQLQQMVAHEMKQPTRNVASREVRGLPDVVAPAKTGSDIIERIAESRKERHEAAVEDMHQELNIISSELEPRIAEAGDELIGHITQNDKLLEGFLSKIDADEDIVWYNMSELEELWECVQKESSIRQSWIEHMDEQLQQIEEDRMDLVKEVFQSYADTLEKIAHLMPPHLHKLLDKDSQLINQAVLSNRRAYSDLYARLMMADIEREKVQHTRWKKRVEDWKNIHIDMAVAEYIAYMESEDVTSPGEVNLILKEMKEQQEQINVQRLDLIKSLRDMRPPGSTKTSVYQWNQQLTAISKQLDQLGQTFLNKLYGSYEEVCQACLAKLEEVKTDLIHREVCTFGKATYIITEKCLPLVGNQQKIFEDSLETMDQQLEEHTNKIVNELKSLFKYSQGAAHVWDVHEIGLAKQERHLQEKLENARRLHDNHNQDKEANLDIIMDRMRQDGSQDTLQYSLNKALDMLNKIKLGYEDFHSQQLEIVDSYVGMVNDEVSLYDKAVCRFFSVDRQHPDEAAVAAKIEELKLEQEKDLTPISPRVLKARRKKGKGRPGSRASSAASSTSGATTPVPMAVSEVLSTAKGTTFYVLTVAGEHGVSSPAPGDRPGSTSAFLTQGEEPTESLPPYLSSIDVPKSLIMEIKNAIRLNFLDHVEEWHEQAVDRSKSVVAAKTEELTSELDLRLHLHQPRPRRAEMDVHNVRAAELVMHSERVSRHCKGIIQSLNDLKHTFNNMNHDHNKLASKFKHDIEQLEVIFINATKSSKLVELQNQIQVELEEYMSVIRASLRDFRQHLDSTLQMLRGSNAKFIKSFKVFSDGGNFCPEEIEEYRKRLEKMSNKIDSSEGFIMADLEGMEAKRLDHATKVAAEFEDRFKSHMFDLIFMEKIARWLTNTQVKIKAEVAESNSQAQARVQNLRDLERRIDACERPNLDKEQISVQELSDSLQYVFDAFNARSVYLNSTKAELSRPSSANLVGRKEVMFNSEVTAVSRPGKQPTEDPSVGVIKSILKSQKLKTAGPDADNIEGSAQQGTITTIEPVRESRDRIQSRVSRQSRMTNDSKSLNNKSTKSLKSAVATPSSEAKRQPSATRRIISKGNKHERKQLPFPAEAAEGDELHFLGHIQQILREAQDGLLATAELYYRQKGSRAVTRPQALQETFEQCADTVITKLESYYKQTDEYHNDCLQEFRSQLVQLEQLVAHVPQLVIKEALKQKLTSASEGQETLAKQFKKKSKKLYSKKVEHENILRPSLGHPHAADELAELCNSEEERRKQYLKNLDEHTKLLQHTAEVHGKEFVETLADITESLLLQYDGLLTVDNVKRGRVEPTKFPTAELIRRKAAGQPLEDDISKQKLCDRGPGTWPGFVCNELVAGGLKGQEKLTETLETNSRTLGHIAVIEARDQAYQEYKENFEQTLNDISTEQEKLIVAEDRWKDNWQTSVEKVKQLY